MAARGSSRRDDDPPHDESADSSMEVNCYLVCFPARPIRLNRDRATTIGRADGNTIVLADSDVSRKHAVVEWVDERFVVRDLSSRNGVYVNDTRVTESPLSQDDRMQIGNRVFTFLIGDDQAVKRLFLRKRQEKQSGATDVVGIQGLSVPSAGFAGSLRDFGLAELLQALELGRKTGRVVVVCDAGRGEMLVRDGQVVRASLGELRNEEAVYRLVGFEDGRFEFENRPVDEPQEISLKTASLLMEGFRLMDEAHRGERPADQQVAAPAPAGESAAGPAEEPAGEPVSEPNEAESGEPSPQADPPAAVESGTSEAEGAVASESATDPPASQIGDLAEGGGPKPDAPPED